jgi:Nif-specific regulatory protein
MPESLLESELFGYERGAFTGAERSRQGRMEAATGGTLFLDEIGDLRAEAQAKLLRAVEQKEIQRLLPRGVFTLMCGHRGDKPCIDHLLGE